MREDLSCVPLGGLFVELLFLRKVNPLKSLPLPLAEAHRLAVFFFATGSKCLWVDADIGNRLACLLCVTNCLISPSGLPSIIDGYHSIGSVHHITVPVKEAARRILLADDVNLVALGQQGFYFCITALYPVCVWERRFQLYIAISLEHQYEASEYQIRALRKSADKRIAAGSNGLTD